MRKIYQNGNYAMTEGEKFALEFLKQKLPLDYEIYIQPNLQGNRPDLIVFHRLQGIFIIEIKDWKLERYFRKNNLLFKREGDGCLQVCEPFFQIERYKFLCSNVLKDVPITCIGYFHNAHSSQVKEILKSGEIEFFGFDNFEEIKHFILKTKTSESIDELKVKNFLYPPMHTKEQGQDIKLTAQQKDLVEHTPHSWRRIKGVAGAGKTIVITQKAANLAAQGKRVLIVCYNTTLKSYLKDNINKSQQEFDWNLIECHHFHELMKIFVEENDGVIGNVKGNFEAYEKTLLESVRTLMKENKNQKSREYDAILIDEAQDFKKEWFDLLLYFLSDNDEILLVADDKQNIYNREISWINESMAGYGYKFKGMWGTLKENIRQKQFPEVIEESNRFYEAFLKEYMELNPDKSFGGVLISAPQKPRSVSRLFNSVDLFWKNIQASQIQSNLLSAYRFLIDKYGYQGKDIVILVSNKKCGKEVKELLESRQIPVRDFLSSSKKERFVGDCEGVRIVTTHSFKGLENGVVIFISDGREDAMGDFETYVAITRATECLIVLNTKEKYKKYGETWKKYLNS